MKQQTLPLLAVALLLTVNVFSQSFTDASHLLPGTPNTSGVAIAVSDMDNDGRNDIVPNNLSIILQNSPQQGIYPANQLARRLRQHRPRYQNINCGYVLGRMAHRIQHPHNQTH